MGQKMRTAHIRLDLSWGSAQGHGRMRMHPPRRFSRNRNWITLTSIPPIRRVPISVFCCRCMDFSNGSEFGARHRRMVSDGSRTDNMYERNAARARGDSQVSQSRIRIRSCDMAKFGNAKLLSWASARPLAIARISGSRRVVMRSRSSDAFFRGLYSPQDSPQLKVAPQRLMAMGRKGNGIACMADQNLTYLVTPEATGRRDSRAPRRMLMCAWESVNFVSPGRGGRGQRLL